MRSISDILDRCLKKEAELAVMKVVSPRPYSEKDAIRL